MGWGVHEFAAALIFADVAPPAPDHAIPVALLSVLGIVLAALITGYFATRSPRETQSAVRLTEAEFRRSLIESRDAAERDLAYAENDLRDGRARLAALEAFLWRRRYDPSRILTGEESPDAVRT